MKSPRTVKCPNCKKEGRWFDGPYGALCSRRCKLIDLGKWLGEEHAISEPLTAARLAETELPGFPSRTGDEEE